MRRASVIPLLVLAGCESLWGGFRNTHDLPCSADMGCRAQDIGAQPQLDVLFLIDNSPLMRDKQLHFAVRMQNFFSVMNTLGLDYHVGVATSDVGNEPAGMSFSGTPPAGMTVGQFPQNVSCGTRAGDNGMLQAALCTGRSGLGAESASACQVACDGRSGPESGLPYLTPSSTAAAAFGCLAFVGDTGCNVEGQLEGARRALDGRNGGFLRHASALGVIFLTDEDDCSVRDAQRAQSEPFGMDCPTAGDNPAAGCYNADYRCFARAIKCGNNSLAVSGPKAGCVEADTGYLEPVDTYVSFLHGLRPDSKLFVGGVWTPRMADGVFTVSGDNTTKTNLKNRVPYCESSGITPIVYSFPQLRLSRFLRGFKNTAEVNICQPDTIVGAMEKMAYGMARLAVGVLSCQVGDVDDAPDHGPPSALFPACGAGCCAAWASAETPLPQEASIVAACAGEPAECYCAVPSTQADVCPGGSVAGVVRKGPAPAGKLTTFACTAL